jgi:hypothetical protein
VFLRSSGAVDRYVGLKKPPSERRSSAPLPPGRKASA